MSLLHGCRHNYVLSYSNVASWKGQESQCDILMSAGGWNVISIKQVVQKDYNHNLQSKSNSLDYSTVFYFDVDLPANKISNSFKDYLSTLKIPVINVCHVLQIKYTIICANCRTIFGENIHCITFRYFRTKIFFWAGKYFWNRVRHNMLCGCVMSLLCRRAGTDMVSEP